MIKIKNSKLNKKEEKILLNVLSELKDSYLDFYITHSNIRLFIKENPEIILKDLEKGDYIIYDTEEKGILFVLGYSDKFPRKYIKLLTKNNSIAGEMLVVLLDNIKEDLYVKINKRNPLIPTLQMFDFEFKAGRGKEILLCRKV